MNLLCRDESCSVYQMKNETGDGTATYYEVYPGIGVMYNDFHMEHCPSRKFEQNTHTFAIHHCREGRVEWEVSNGAYLYLASGDIMLDSSATLTARSGRAANCSATCATGSARRKASTALRPTRGGGSGGTWKSLCLTAGG